jgi:hypothetical protein
LKIAAGSGSVDLGKVGEVTKPESVIIVSGVARLGDIATSGAQSYGGSITLTGALIANSVTMLGPATVEKDITASISTKDVGGTITLAQIDGGGVLKLDAGAGTVSITGAIGASEPLGGLTITASSTLLPSKVSLAGTSSIQNASFLDASAIDIASGTLTFATLSATDLTATGAGKIRISDATVSGSAEFQNSEGVDFSKTNSFGNALTVSGPTAVIDTLTIRGSANFNDQLTLNGSMTSNGSMRLLNTATLAGTLVATGGLSAATIRLDGALTIDAEAGATINGLNGPSDATIRVGAAGQLQLGPVGDQSPLLSFRASAGTIDLGSVVTQRSQSYASVLRTNLRGSLSAGTGSTISVTGALALPSGDQSLTVGGISENNRILLDSLIGPSGLQLTARGGGVLLAGVDQSAVIGSLNSEAAITMVAGSSSPADRARLEGALTGALRLFNDGGVVAEVAYLTDFGGLPGATLRSDGRQTFNGGLIVSGAITAGGGLAVSGATLLAGDSQLKSDGNAIALNRLDGAGPQRAALIDAGSGSVSLGGVGEAAPLGATAIKAAGGVTLNGNILAKNLAITGPVQLGQDLTITTGPVDGGLRVAGSINGGGRTLTVSAGSGEVSVTGAIGGAGALSSLAILNASDVTINEINARILSVTARGTVQINSARSNSTSISAARIIGRYDVAALSLDANFANVTVSIGGRSDASIISRIGFGRSGVYLINGVDAASILQSSMRGIGSERLSLLLRALQKKDSDKESDETKEEAGADKKAEGKRPLLTVLNEDKRRSAASEDGVPGLRQRFPILANFAKW